MLFPLRIDPFLREIALFYTNFNYKLSSLWSKVENYLAWHCWWFGECVSSFSWVGHRVRQPHKSSSSSKEGLQTWRVGYQLHWHRKRQKGLFLKIVCTDLQISAKLLLKKCVFRISRLFVVISFCNASKTSLLVVPDSSLTPATPKPTTTPVMFSTSQGRKKKLLLNFTP